MVSTLGGGYFLVKDIPHSIALAKKQASLAFELGDDVAWRASNLHLVYIAIQCGAWEHGRRLIKELTELAIPAGDSKLLAMLYASSGYLDRTKLWEEEGGLSKEDAHRQRLCSVEGDLLDNLLKIDRCSAFNE